MLTKEEVRTRRDEVLALAARHGAADVRIFGSVGRGDATDDSDLDLVVRFERGRSLQDQQDLQSEMATLLQVEVHVIDERSLDDQLKEQLRREGAPL